MRSVHPSPSSLSVAGLYAFGFLLFFWPFADLVSNALPLQPGEIQWRYGFAGLMASYLHTPMLGLALVTSVAYALGHTRALRLLSAFELLMVLGLLLITAAFALDLLQVRASRPEEVRGAVMVGGVIAIAKHLSAAAVILLMGIGGWKTASATAEAAGPKESGGGAAGIVIKKRGAS